MSRWTIAYTNDEGDFDFIEVAALDEHDATLKAHERLAGTCHYDVERPRKVTR